MTHRVIEPQSLGSGERGWVTMLPRGLGTWKNFLPTENDLLTDHQVDGLLMVDAIIQPAMTNQNEPLKSTGPNLNLVAAYIIHP